MTKQSLQKMYDDLQSWIEMDMGDDIVALPDNRPEYQTFVKQAKADGISREDTPQYVTTLIRDALSTARDEPAVSKVEKSRPKTGGRKPGTPNKKSVWLREELESVGLSWGAEFKKAILEGDTKRAEVLVALLPYLNPKIKEQEYISDSNESSDTEKSDSELLKLAK